jgi:uncharacterized protein with FMN-binding domain
MTNHPRPASLARRALPALAVLGASGALLTQLGGAKEVGAQSLATTTTGRVAGGSVATTQPPATQPPATQPPATRAPTTTIRSGAAAAAAAPTTTTAPKVAAGSNVTTPAGACTGTTYTGAASANKYGVVQVAAVISADKQLCDVQVLAYPSNDRKSLAINERALPTLRTEAIAANGAHIAGVTGATITSRGYEASLQSAIDAAG